MNSRKRRHRDGGTFISDADDVVSAMIMKMNEAAEVRALAFQSKSPTHTSVGDAEQLYLFGRRTGL